MTTQATDPHHPGIIDYAISDILNEPFGLIDSVRIHVMERGEDGRPKLYRATVYSTGWGHVNAESDDMGIALAAARDILHAAIRKPVKSEVRDDR